LRFLATILPGSFFQSLPDFEFFGDDTAGKFFQSLPDFAFCGEETAGKFFNYNIFQFCVFRRRYCQEVFFNLFQFAFCGDDTAGKFFNLFQFRGDYTSGKFFQYLPILRFAATILQGRFLISSSLRFGATILPGRSSISSSYEIHISTDPDVDAKYEIERARNYENQRKIIDLQRQLEGWRSWHDKQTEQQ